MATVFGAGVPAWKAKAKAKPKAKGSGKAGGVAEERPKNEEDLRTAMSLMAIFSKSDIVNLSFDLSGSMLKREMNQCNMTALDLPKDHALRKTLLSYKTRFEEQSDELLGVYI